MLDTCVISADLNTRHSQHAEVHAFLDRLDPNAHVFITVVSIGEMEFGLELAHQNGLPLTDLSVILSKVKECEPRILSPTKHTAREYGQIKTALAKKHCPHKSNLGRKYLPRWPEKWLNEVTSELLGVDENDLWIAAHAVAQNLTLITYDTDFKRIKEAVPHLRLHMI